MDGYGFGSYTHAQVGHEVFDVLYALSDKKV